MVVAEDRVVVPPLADAVSELVLREARSAAASAAKLAELSSAVPHLVAATTRPDRRHLTEVHPLDGELSSGGNPLELLQLMVRTSRGDMLWLRPDAWAMPRESQVSEMLAEAMATGRRSRAIYPVRALTEAPEALRDARPAGRAGAGHLGGAAPGCSSSATPTPCCPSRSASPTSRGCTSGSARSSRR